MAHFGQGGATVGLYAKLKKGKTKKQLPAPETARDGGGRFARRYRGVSYLHSL